MFEFILDGDNINNKHEAASILPSVMPSAQISPASTMRTFDDWMWEVNAHRAHKAARVTWSHPRKGHFVPLNTIDTPKQPSEFATIVWVVLSLPVKLTGNWLRKMSKVTIVNALSVLKPANKYQLLSTMLLLLLLDPTRPPTAPSPVYEYRINWST